MKCFVYVLLSLKDNQWYIGQTDQSPEDRLREHNDGKSESTKYRRPFELIYYEMYLNKEDALGREKFLKSGSGHSFIKKQLKNYFIIRRGVEQPGSSLGS
ncbi:MAG: GIY-YIG nuclease family protein [Candidatus Omnitrophica bacterium]|nr:GIY-YIG nuclease family protein [Candidatus Omnitrophota bacterium]